MGNAMKYLGFVSGGLNTAAGLATSLISQSQQRKENEKNRQFNAQQAQLNRDFQSQMFDRSNAWNSPAAQVNRLRSAGLNPALMYQGSTFGQPAVSPSGSQASSGSSGLPGIQAPNYEGALMQAQIDNINADTKNKEITNSYLPQIMQGEINEQNSRITLNSSVSNKNEKEAQTFEPLAKKLFNEADNFKALTEYYQEYKASVHEDVLYKRIQNTFASKEFEAKIINLQAQTGLAKAQCQEILMLLCLKAANIEADTFFKNEQAKTEANKRVWYSNYAHLADEQATNEILKGAGIEINNQQMEFDYQQAKDWDSIMKSAQVSYLFAGAANDIVSTGFDLRNNFGGRNQIGFKPPQSYGSLRNRAPIGLRAM